MNQIFKSNLYLNTRKHKYAAIVFLTSAIAFIGKHFMYLFNIFKSDFRLNFFKLNIIAFISFSLCENNSLNLFVIFCLNSLIRTNKGLNFLNSLLRPLFLNFFSFKIDLKNVAHNLSNLI